MHHGQSRGETKIRYTMQKHVHFTKPEGKFAKVGRNKNFFETGGKCTENPKIGELQNYKFVVDD